MIAKHSIPFRKNETQNRLFKDEFILQKGSILSELYQLISGSAYMIDESGQIIYSFPPNAYLNLNEQRYKLHNLKTIKAGTLCEVAISWPSLGELRQMHDQNMSGTLRKIQIPLLTSLSNQNFEEISQYFTRKVLTNLQELPYQPDQFYIVAEGHYEFTSSCSKLLTLSRGETFTLPPRIKLRARSSVNALLSIPLPILREILADSFDNIHAFNRKQLEIIERFARYTLLKGIEFPISQQEDVSKAFRNKIKQKIERMERKQKARSVTLKKDGSRMNFKEEISEMKRENRRTFLSMLQKQSLRHQREYFKNQKIDLYKNQKSVSCLNLLALVRKERMSSPNPISQKHQVAASERKFLPFERDTKPRMTCCDITRIHDVSKQIKKVSKLNERKIAKFKTFRS